VDWINPLKAELNPICYLLALLGAHHFLHVSRIRVNLAQDRNRWLVTLHLAFNPPDCIQYGGVGGFLDQLRKYWFRKDSAAWSLLVGWLVC